MPKLAKMSPALVVLLVLGPLAGCGGGGSQQGGPGTAAPAPAPAPPPPQPEVKVPEGSFSLVGDPHAQKGGTFVQYTNSFPTHLNYFGPERDNTLDTLYKTAFFDALINVHPNTLEYVPDVATSWDVSEDQKVITFHMDPDAKWSDGTAITAKDVAFTIDLIRNPKVSEVAIKVDLDDKFPNGSDGKKCYEIIDDHTIKFTGVKSSWRNLLFFAGLPIMPSHKINPDTYLEDWKFQVPVVSGMYTLGKYEKDKFITLERRKDFWGQGKRQFVGTGNFDVIYTKVYLTDDLAFEAAKKGDIDFYLVTRAQRWHEDVDKIDKVKKGWIQKARMKNQYPESPSQMAFNLTDPLFSDVRVRKAMFWLYNREYLHDQLFFHEYTNKNSYWPNSMYENPTNEKYTFTPDKGLALLKEAGWTAKDKDGTLVKDGKRFEFDFIYIHKDAERVYTPLQETYRKYGIKMNLKLISPSAWIKLSQKKEFGMIYANWGAVPFPTPRDMWHSEMADKEDTSNIGHFKNPEVDKLIEEYEQEPDLKKRAGIVQKMDAIIYDACPYLLDWYSDNFRMLWWDKFGMPEWMSYATQDPRECLWQVWWYDASKAKALEEAMKSGGSVPQQKGDNTYWAEHKL